MLKLADEIASGTSDNVTSGYAERVQESQVIAMVKKRCFRILDE